MALRAGYYGIKRFLRDELQLIAGTYDETIKSLFPRSEQAVLGAYNILPYPYPFNPSLPSGTDVVFSGDGAFIVANGLYADENRSLQLTARADNETTLKLKKGNYVFSGNALTDGSTYLQVFTTKNNAFYQIAVTTDSTEVAFSVTDDIIVSGKDYACIGLNVGVVKNHSVTNAVFKPMISLSGGKYVPYAMTNKELTDSAADQKTAINVIITAATGAADFAAFKTAMGAITPVTRSLSLTKEDITEEVKEDVEPEKTVTKKRTTKKTEEV